MAEKLFEIHRQLLECRVCSEKLRPPIVTCVNGHGICGACKPELNNNVCAMCSQGFPEEKNVLLNQLVETLPTECKYEKEGCKHKGTMKNIADHENVCCYKPDCSCILCKKKLSFMKLKNHFHDEHIMARLDWMNLRVRWSETFDLEFKPSILSYDEIVCVNNNKREMFVVRCYVDWSEEVFLFLVQYIGEKVEAKRYKYNVSFHKRLLPADLKVNRDYFSFDGICLPYFYSEDETHPAKKTIKLGLESIFFDSIPLEDGFKITISLSLIK